MNSPRPPSRAWSWFRRAAFVLMVLALVAGLVLVGTVWWLGFTDHGDGFLDAQLERAIGGAMQRGSVRIGETDLMGLNQLKLTDFQLLDDDGKVILDVPHARARFRLGPLFLARRLQVDELALRDANLVMTQGEDGLDLVRLFAKEKPSEEAFDGLGIDIVVRRAVFDPVHIDVQTDDHKVIQLTGIQGEGSVSLVGPTLELRGVDLKTVMARPGPIPLRVGGTASWHGTDGFRLDKVRVRTAGTDVSVTGVVNEAADLTVRGDQLDLETVDDLIGGAGLRGDWSGDVRVVGPKEQISVVARLDGMADTRGRLDVRGSMDASGDKIKWGAVVDANALHPEDVSKSIAGSWLLDGRLKVDGEGVRWPDGVRANFDWQSERQVVAGQELDKLTARGTLAKGKLQLQNAVVVSDFATLAVQGEVDLSDGPIQLSVKGPIHTAELARLGINGLVYPVVADAVLSGNPRSEDLPWSVKGKVKGSPFAYNGLVRADWVSADVDVAVMPNDTGPTLVGQASFVSGGLTSLGGTSAGSASSSQMRFAKTPERLTVDGMVSLSDVRATSALSVAELDLDVSSVQTSGGLEVQAAGPMRDIDLLQRPNTDGFLSVQMVDKRVAFEATIEDFGRMTTNAQGTFQLDSRDLVVDRLALRPTPRLAFDLTRPLVATVTEQGSLSGLDLSLAGDLGRASVQGLLGASGPLDATIDLTEVQLDVLAELYPDVLAGLSGRLAQAEVTLKGTAEQTVATSTVELQGLWWAESVRWLDAVGRVDYQDGHFDVALDTSTAGDELAHIRGTVPGALSLADVEATVDPDRDASLEVAVHPGDLKRWPQVFPALAEQTPTGQGSWTVSVVGPLIDPDVRLVGLVEVPVLGWTKPGRLEFDMTRDAEVVEGWMDIREGLVARSNIALYGATDANDALAFLWGRGPEVDIYNPELWLSDLSSHVALLGVPSTSLSSVLGSKTNLIRGELVGGLSIFGSPLEPDLQLSLSASEVTIGSQKMEAAFATLVKAEKGYQLDIGLDFGEQGSFDVHGSVPLSVLPMSDFDEWTSGELDLEISGDGLPLSLIAAYDPRFKKPVGLLKVQGAVKGSLLRPQPELEASIVDGGMIFSPLGIQYDSIQLDFEASGDRLRLKRLSAEPKPSKRFQTGLEVAIASTPRIQMAGSAMLDGVVLDALSARVELSNAAWLMATDESRLRMDGAVTFSGAWPALNVGGKLSLVTGRMEADAAGFLEASPLALDPSLTVARSDVASVPPLPQEPPLYKDFLVDVDLDLKRNLNLDLTIPFIDDLGALGAAVTRADLSTRIGGEVKLGLANAEPTVLGEVDLLDGKVRILQSRFELEEGRITFSGGDPFNPELDIDAAMRVTNASVNLDIQGTPSDPELAFSSPEYSDREQIMTILLTGQAPDDLTGEEGSGTARALAGLVLNSVFSGQSLGSLSIEPDGTVRLGIPVSSSIFAWTSVQPIADPNENRLTLAAEWGVLPRVVLGGGIGDRQAWTDLFWEFRF